MDQKKAYIHIIVYIYMHVRYDQIYLSSLLLLFWLCIHVVTVVFGSAPPAVPPGQSAACWPFRVRFRAENSPRPHVPFAYAFFLQCRRSWVGSLSQKKHDKGFGGHRLKRNSMKSTSNPFRIDRAESSQGILLPTSSSQHP